MQKSGNLGKIWSAVRSVRSETLTTSHSSKFMCASNHMLDNQVSQVDAVEHLLGMESSDQPIHNISNKNLKYAADMLIYLAVCPGKYNAWIKFYNDLFERDSPNRILLALNRIRKKTNILNGTFKTVAQNSFQTVTKALEKNIPGGKRNLKFEDTNIMKSFDFKGREKMSFVTT